MKITHNHQKTVLFLTGLSGAGKTTLAHALQRTIEQENVSIIILDGDVMRQHLSSDLGFSKKDRNTHVYRVTEYAISQLKQVQIIIIALIAPYTEMRQTIRQQISKHAEFIEIYVATPLSVCEQRDIKGLYAKARAGEIKQFTGIDDPYEIPTKAEIVIDTSILSVKDCVQVILSQLVSK